MYVDIPDSHHEELRPAINMSSELFYAARHEPAYGNQSQEVEKQYYIIE